MSYDLYLRADKAFGIDEFNAYFSGRPNYACENGQAAYSNGATGVYFTFDFSGEDAEQEDLDPEAPAYSVAFNLNYYRPHFFALEAAPEVQAFIDRFGFAISDPQNAGMGEGPFSVEGFLRGWNHGNEFGYRAILTSEGASQDIRARPTAELEAIWRWNMTKDGLQAALGENAFVPKIFWGILEGREYSMVVWPDGIPTVIPQVEMLVIGRDELGPRKLFRKVKDTCFVPREQAERLLAPLEDRALPLSCHFPHYEAAPPDLRKFIEGLPADSRQLSGLAMDAVLNRELVEAARKPR